MRLKSMASALVGALVVTSFALTASPEPQPDPQQGMPQGTQFAGQMTEAHVWVDNRGREQAIPVDLRAVNLDRPLRVQVVNDPQFGQTGPVPVRAVRALWEYQTMTLGPNDDLVARLNTLGADGWEAAGIVSLSTQTTTVMFKRPRATQ